jgi:hypothetical protein
MAVPLDAAAVPVAPAFEESGGAVEQARTLIGALNLLSRNLPLPPAVLRAVSSIYHDGDAGDEEDVDDEEELAAVVEGGVEEGGSEETAVVDEAGAGDAFADGAAAEVRAVGSSLLRGEFPFRSGAQVFCTVLD